MDQILKATLELLKQDAREAMAAARGKGQQPGNMERDTHAAFYLFLKELIGVRAFVTSRRMNANAVLADQRITTTLQQAVRLGGETNDEKKRTTQPESSSWAASRQPRRSQDRRACTACGESKHILQLARAPCKHEYCGECLTHFFLAATEDESRFPPRCCRTDIDLDSVLPFLDPDVANKFRKKAIELSTPNRIYCHDPSCASFIVPANYFNDIATCDDCGRRTCMFCKNAEHAGDCPADEKIQKLIQLARAKHWQRCQQCKRFIQLKMGCWHITCVCRFQFCFICGAAWRTCQCDSIHQFRLRL